MRRSTLWIHGGHLAIPVNGIFNCEAGGDWEYEVLGLGSSGELDQIGKNSHLRLRGQVGRGYVS